MTEWLTAENIAYVYPGRREIPALRKFSFRFERGVVYTICGPNGSGKSTLLSLLAGLLRSPTGVVRLEGRALSDWPLRHRARRIAWVAQTVPDQLPFTVRETVALGRYPWRSGWQNHEHGDDARAIAEALAATALEKFASRSFNCLSGGEKQRVMIARALAQEPEYLLCDEPAGGLDLGNKLELHRLFTTLAQNGKCVISVSHDLLPDLALTQRLLLLAAGELVFAGAPAELNGRDILTRVFGAAAELTIDPGKGLNIRFS